MTTPQDTIVRRHSLVCENMLNLDGEAARRHSEDERRNWLIAMCLSALSGAIMGAGLTFAGMLWWAQQGFGV